MFIVSKHACIMYVNRFQKILAYSTILYIQTCMHVYRKSAKLKPWAIKAVFKELWCNPDKRVTPFPLFKQIFPLFSVLFFPLYQ